MTTNKSCLNQSHLFCYIYGEYVISGNGRPVNSVVKQMLYAYLGMKPGDQDKTWIPHVVSKVCVERQ